MLPQEKRKLLAKLREKLSSETVFVEGAKDVKAIEKAGFGAGAIAVNSRRPQRVVEKSIGQVDGKEVLLLFDFDEEGRRKTMEFEGLVRSAGGRVDAAGRKAFRALFRLRTIEELPTALIELEKEI